MIKDISYVSIAVNNIDTAIRDFNRVYGLHEVTPITHSRAFGWLRVILGNGPEAFLELLQPVDDKLPLGRFLQGRGESFYLFSLQVDNIAAVARNLRAKNVRFASFPQDARPERIRTVWIHPRATTGLYIELSERLLENQLMGFGAGGVSRDILLKEVSYQAVVVRDIESASNLYQDILGLEVVSPRNTEPTLNFERVVLGTADRGILELMQPNDPTTAMGRYLESRGEGPYMVCFITDDVQKSVEAINSRGGRAHVDPNFGGFVHPNTNHGVLFQLSTRYLTRRRP